MGLCIYRPLDLTPNFYLAVLGPNLYILARPPIYVYEPWPKICIYQPYPKYYFTSLGAKFAYADLDFSICICISGPGLSFLLPVQGLDLHLPDY